MSVIIESNFLASKWKINKSRIGEDISGKLRSLQIRSYYLERMFVVRQVNIRSIEYFYEKNRTYLEVAIKARSIKKFYEHSSYFWRWICEDFPLHRNDKWDEEKMKPTVSEAYHCHANGDLILLIKFNVDSKRYYFPTADELKLNDYR